MHKLTNNVLYGKILLTERILFQPRRKKCEKLEEQKNYLR